MGRNKKSGELKILLVSPLPPPYSGYERITQTILESELVNRFRIVHQNTSNLRPTNRRGKFDFVNIIMTVIRVGELLMALVIHRPQIANIPIAQNRAGFLKYASFILLTSLFRCRIVSRLGGDSFDHFFNRSSKTFQRYIRFVLNRIDILIVRAERLRSQFDGLLPKERVRVVYLGIDLKDYSIGTDRYRSLSRSKRNKPFTILFMGYISKAKGALDVLQCVSKVTSKHKNIRFKFVGFPIQVERNIVHIKNPADIKEAAERIIREESIGEFVEFMGQLVGIKKMEAFADADLFVFPSYSEGFPFTILEAMAFGLPIITTPVGALPEVMVKGKNALFVEIGDYHDLGEKIIEVIENPLLRMNMGIANRKLVEEKFGIERFSQDMEKIFYEAART